VSKLFAFFPKTPETRSVPASLDAAPVVEKRSLKQSLHLLGKYGSTSLVSTAADFSVFHLALTGIGATAVGATVAGRLMGSSVAFLLHRSWVFTQARERRGNILIARYVLGISIGMLLNVAGVGLLNGIAGMAPWPARVITATTVWLFGFLFNKKIVFG
jgi:putative flippase GtrA